jgi:hypothetical protein
VSEAVDLGELRPDTDPAQLAYEIDALGEAAITHARLLGRRDVAYERARRAVRDRLNALTTEELT